MKKLAIVTVTVLLFMGQSCNTNTGVKQGNTEQGIVEWKEAVTDEEYNNTK